MGAGGSEARFAVGAQSVELSASYITDALGDLLRATGVILEGSDSAQVSWEEEPGRYDWLLDRVGTAVRVRVVEWYWGGRWIHRVRSAVILDATCPVQSFAAAVANGARPVLDRHGEKGYLEAWIRHPFPTEELAEIEANL